jgi:hypothetical protein
MFYRVSNGGTEFKARFTITGYVGLRGGTGGNWTYGDVNGSLSFTDTDDIRIASYNVISGTVNVTHEGDVWTFQNANVSIYYLESQSTGPWRSTSVVEITFER